MIKRRFSHHLKAAIKSLLPERVHFYGDYAYSQVTAPLYWGNAVECVLCGGHFRKFLPWYGGSTPVRCPACRSLQRHRLLHFYLREKTDLLTAPHRLLHLAPEFLIQRQLKKCANIDYLSGDLSSPLATMHFDLTNVPLPSDSFSAIICNQVLEHIPDDRAAMREMFRLLRPGGWAILMVPIDVSGPTREDLTITDPRERERLFGQHDHWRIYGSDYPARLGEAGFETALDGHAATFSDADAARFGINRHDVVPVARKPG